MAYKRKTQDVYKIYGNYGYGSEVIDIAENKNEAYSLVREYRMAHSGGSIYFKRGRVPIIPQKKNKK